MIALVEEPPFSGSCAGGRRVPTTLGVWAGYLFKRPSAVGDRSTGQESVRGGGGSDGVARRRWTKQLW